MESRLPKPKIMIKANSITDITEVTKNNNHEITKNNNISASTSTLTSISTTVGLISMKSMNEN